MIETLFYLSPEYQDKFTNIRGTLNRDDEPACEGNKSDDKRDTFPSWVRENTFIDSIESRNEGEDISGLGKLMGENGALCGVSHQKFHKNPEHHFPLGEYGRYRRVVEVSVMPSSKGISAELKEALESRAYKETSRKSWYVQQLFS